MSVIENLIASAKATVGKAIVSIDSDFSISIESEGAKKELSLLVKNQWGDNEIPVDNFGEMVSCPIVAESDEIANAIDLLVSDYSVIKGNRKMLSRSQWA